MLPSGSHKGSVSRSYYSDRCDSLRDIFGAREVRVTESGIWVDDRTFPVIDDVIICLEPSRWPKSVRARLGSQISPASASDAAGFAEDIQFTFGEEWGTFNAMLDEHEETFTSYFDLVDLPSLREQRLCDLGCGMGRWSYFASEHCREIVLVDFSDAIFVARRTLSQRSNAIFVMADVRQLPFRNDFSDFIFSLGVLHHLPCPPLPEVARLRDYAPKLLIYLYYALDNRPSYFKSVLGAVSKVRARLSSIRNRTTRSAIVTFIALFVYIPLVALGTLARPFGLARFVPLYEGYKDQGWTAIRQDAYDRFFTRIEHRVSRKEILEVLSGAFRRIQVSDRLPYWHFLCER